MASVKDTASFFAHGNSKQYEFVLTQYQQVVKLKAEKRTKKPEELIRLDDWYQNELPKKIKQRGKDAHINHEELVQTMKWKQQRGKFYPQLSYLIKVNTPRAVMQETKKAFRKLPNLEQALTALSNLKGVGITMASALLAAAAPESAPFMADECLKAIPEIEGIDYTTKAYLNFVSHVDITVKRLNSEKDIETQWTPHRVELAIWTHYVASELQPDLLENMPEGVHPISNGASTTTTTTTTTASTTTNLEEEASSEIVTLDPSDESNLEPAAPANGKSDERVIELDESTRSEDSLENSTTPIVAIDDSTNDSETQSSAKRSLDCESSGETTEENDECQPEIKKMKNE